MGICLADKFLQEWGRRYKFAEQVSCDCGKIKVRACGDWAAPTHLCPTKPHVAEHRRHLCRWSLKIHSHRSNSKAIVWEYGRLLACSVTLSRLCLSKLPSTLLFEPELQIQYSLVTYGRSV